MASHDLIVSMAEKLYDISTQYRIADFKAGFAGKRSSGALLPIDEGGEA